jgi:hypothetical protein
VEGEPQTGEVRVGLVAEQAPEQAVVEPQVGEVPPAEPHQEGTPAESPTRGRPQARELTPATPAGPTILLDGTIPTVTNNFARGTRLNA